MIHNHINKLEQEKKQQINNILIKKGISNRKTDEVKVLADYAQEYMYIFSERNYPWQICDKNKNLFDELCKKIQYISENKNPILLKNPYDFANFLYIKKIYPKSKFIFIHRNPYEIISSTMRLWQTHLKSKNEYLAMYYKRYDKLYSNPISRFFWKKIYLSKIPIGLYNIVLFSSNRTNKYLNDIKYLPENDYLVITYENLCNNTDNVIKEIEEFLNVKINIDLGKYIKPRALKLTSEVEFWKKLISKKMKLYIEYLKKYK